MQSALIATAFISGLAAGPHCVVMCGAACAGVVRLVRAPAGGVAVLQPPVAGASGGMRAVAFHAGRAAGYAAAGAVAAAAVQAVAWAGEQVAALRPLWLLLHVGIFAWGLVMVAFGRQPFWAQRLIGGLATALRTVNGSTWRVVGTGVLWAAMPCGLLYSALMLAALGNGPVHGALVMTAFAAGSGLALALAPWLWERLQRRGASRREWGARLAGAVLAGVALKAVWHDLEQQILRWCQ
ncbi:MAG: sulfite exporter TauE/SafE family protein [Variovorax sp.]|nr:MAG: sulfite exporter TauE/SafE family protein [Variovorax sp.]